MEVSQPDLVRDTKLDITVKEGGTLQVHYLSNPAKGERRVRVEQVWKREKELGRGAFGVVYLEQCSSGYNQGHTRAVKRLRKQDDPSISYHRELEAIAKFSQKKVREMSKFLETPTDHYFVRSIGTVSCNPLVGTRQKSTSF